MPPLPLPHPAAAPRLLTLALLAALCSLVPGATAQGPLLSPAAVAYDAAGDLFIADSARHQVLEATLGGQLQLIAGNGLQGFSGDGGPALAAELNEPSALALAPDGTLYIADTGNQRVRVVSPAGIITTFAGTGLVGAAGDGFAAGLAQLSSPAGLALDSSGALWIADTGNHRIRRVAGGTISTVVGTGVQGFAGDGGPATAAELDSPTGIALDALGNLLIADRRNHRLRRLSVATGLLTTVAGTGLAGFSGDGSSATAAALDLPAAVAVAADSSLPVADTANHRVRTVVPAAAILTTVGDGQQGSASDGALATTAELDSPRGLAFSPWGGLAIADPPNHSVLVLASDGTLRLPAALAAAGRSSGVTLSLPSATVYGQGSATATVSGSVGTPQGSLRLQQGTSTLLSGTLTAGAVTLPLSSLAAGAYDLVAQYTGDGLNPAATSAAAQLQVDPAPVLAVAQSVSVGYGAQIPALTGTSTGVLPQDVGQVQTVFSTPAVAGSPAGLYPITAALTGAASSNYVVSLSSGSGALRITPASTTVQALQPVQSSYAGLPLVLSATVSSLGLQPSGTVTFTESGAVVASGPLSGGRVQATYPAPTAGSHTLVPNYLGSGNFAPSVGAAIVATVAAMPDFTLSGGSSQTVQPGSIASYNISVSGQGPFSGAVSLSVSGLPSGATATFTPPEVVPGSGVATSTLSVQTPATLARAGSVRGWWLACLLPLLGLTRKRKRPLVGCIATVLAVSAWPWLAGCGARTVSEATQPAQTYTLTVTGTGTNLAGQVVTHQATVTLQVE